jgi:hypothetical protein
MTWQGQRMSELEAIAQECEKLMAQLGEEIEEAEDTGDTVLASMLQDEYDALSDKRDEAMDEWGQLDEGFTPGYAPDYYYPSPLEIAQNWF